MDHIEDHVRSAKPKKDPLLAPSLVYLVCSPPMRGFLVGCSLPLSVPPPPCFPNPKSNWKFSQKVQDPLLLRPSALLLVFGYLGLHLGPGCIGQYQGFDYLYPLQEPQYIGSHQRQVLEYIDSRSHQELECTGIQQSREPVSAVMDPDNGMGDPGQHAHRGLMGSCPLRSQTDPSSDRLNSCLDHQTGCPGNSVEHFDGHTY